MKVRTIYNSNSKESIVEGIRNGDDFVYEYLYKEYKLMIKKLVITNSGNSDDAEDIWQDGIIALMEKIKSNKNFVFSCEVNTYIYSICRNLWFKVLRKKKNDIPFVDVHHEKIEVDFPDEAELTAKHLLVAQLINELGEQCRKIITLYYYQNLSMIEIANNIGYTNDKNAKNQKYKCINSLREKVIVRFKSMGL